MRWAGLPSATASIWMRRAGLVAFVNLVSAVHGHGDGGIRAGVHYGELVREIGGGDWGGDGSHSRVRGGRRDVDGSGGEGRSQRGSTLEQAGSRYAGTGSFPPYSAAERRGVPTVSNRAETKTGTVMDARPAGVGEEACLGVERAASSGEEEVVARGISASVPIPVDASVSGRDAGEKSYSTSMSTGRFGGGSPEWGRSVWERFHRRAGVGVCRRHPPRGRGQCLSRRQRSPRRVSAYNSAMDAQPMCPRDTANGR
jgi:hypothetical protein